MKKKLLFSGLVLLSTTSLAACSAAPGASSQAASGTEIGKTLKIGLNLELTGNVSAYGSAEEKGAKLAVDEINKAGGVDGKTIEVITKDNKSDNSEAATVTTNLATESKVNIVVGPATSGATAAASPNASKAVVPLITPSGTTDNLTLTSDGKTNPYVFRTTFVDSYQGDVLAKYASDHLKAKQVVLFYDNSSDYSKGIAKRFKKVYTDTIVAEATFQSGDTDFQSALTKLKDKEYDAIVMPGYYQETGTIIKQAREMGIASPILGPDGFADDKLVELAGASNVNKVYYISGFSASTSDKAVQFVKAYQAKYGTSPSMFAALAYDSIYMAADAAKDSKTSVDLAKRLAKLKDFEGVTGTMTIDKQHNPIKPVSVVELTNGKESSATTVTAD